MKLIYIPALMILPAIALASCSHSDRSEPEQNSQKVRSAWVKVNISTGEQTRADYSKIDDSNDPSTMINSLTVYLTDEEDVIVGAGIGDMNSKEYDDDVTRQKMSVLASLYCYTELEPNKVYRVRAIANSYYLNDLASAAVIGTVGSHKGLKYNYSALDFSADQCLPVDGMPLSTALDDYATLNISGNSGTADDPYSTSSVNDGKNVVKLTRMMASVEYDPGFSANKFTLTNFASDEEGDQSQNLDVEFISMAPVNVVSSTYLLPTVNLGIVSVPVQSTWYGRVTQSGYTSSTQSLLDVMSVTTQYPLHKTGNFVKRLFYVTENAQPKSTVTKGNTTGVVMTALLQPTDNTPVALKTWFTGASHPDLAYYDDGTYQSGLVEYDAVNMISHNWHIVKWETVTVGETDHTGYVLRYYKAIRHGGISSDSYENTGNVPEGSKDGVIEDMEYAVVRNHRYILKVKSVSSFPHPFVPSEIPEDGKQDIDITVTVPAYWYYDRTSINLDPTK